MKNQHFFLLIIAKDSFHHVHRAKISTDNISNQFSNILKVKNTNSIC